MVARLRGSSHWSSIHSVVIKGNSAWMPTAIPAASPSVTSNPNTSATSQRRIRMTGDPSEDRTTLQRKSYTIREMAAAENELVIRGPTMFARIGVMRALNRHVERVFNPDRKDHHWGRRKLARDR